MGEYPRRILNPFRIRFLPESSVARKSKTSGYSYSRTATIRGREEHGRYAVIQKGREHTRVVRRRPDGTAPGPGELISTEDLVDLRPTEVVVLGQRGTLTLPGDFRRDLGLVEGTPLEILLEEDGTISIRPLVKSADAGLMMALEDLLDRVTPENLHHEVTTGEAVGREAW
jgi:antitoxin MazE